MASLHHATIARATKLGVRIIDLGEADGHFQLVRLADDMLSTEKFDTAKGAVQAMADGEVTFETSKSLRNHSGVMVISYHKIYTANGGGNGDVLDVTLRDMLKTDDGIDLDLLRQIADANGVWVDTWTGLNPGMQRMNLANRLRAILRNAADAQIVLLDQTGRFGVPFRPSQKAAKRLAKKG